MQTGNQPSQLFQTNVIHGNSIELLLLWWCGFLLLVLFTSPFQTSWVGFSNTSFSNWILCLERKKRRFDKCFPLLRPGKSVRTGPPFTLFRSPIAVHSFILDHERARFSQVEEVHHMLVMDCSYIIILRLHLAKSLWSLLHKPLLEFTQFLNSAELRLRLLCTAENFDFMDLSLQCDDSTFRSATTTMGLWQTVRSGRDVILFSSNLALRIYV